MNMLLQVQFISVKKKGRPDFVFIGLGVIKDNWGVRPFEKSNPLPCALRRNWGMSCT